MKNNTEELAVASTTALTTQEETNALSMEDMMEELDGLGSITLDQVKIPSGGGMAFEVPNPDDPESPDVAKVLKVVIVHHQPKNVYFRDKFGTSDVKLPECSSSDGKTGYITANGAERTCASCRYNQFGSGDGGGKACQNRIDLYMITDGATFPMVLSLPATSIKAFKDYLTKIVLRGQRLYQVVTEIALKKAKSAGGVDYSTCVFRKAGNVPVDDVANNADMRELCRSLATMQRTAELTPEGDDSTDGFTEIVDAGDGDEDFPF